MSTVAERLKSSLSKHSWFFSASLSLVFLFAIPLRQGQALSAEIKKVDFYNFTYRPECNQKKPVTVRNGTFETPKNSRTPENYVFFQISTIIYGDLTNDGRDEAVILTICNTGGTGTLYEGVIYGMRGNRPVALTSIEGGDRADGGIIGVKVQDGLLVLDRAMSAQAACTQDFAVEVSKFRLNGNRLVTVGKVEHREPSLTEKSKFCTYIDPTKPIERQLKELKVQNR